MLNKKIWELTEENNKKLLAITQEHTRLAREATEISITDPDRTAKTKEITARIDELREQRRALIGE